MDPLLLPAPPAFSRTLLLWLLARLAGGTLLVVALICLVNFLDESEPAASTDRDFADGVGGGVMLGLFAIWGTCFDFFCSLPLLLVLPGQLRRVLRVPDGPRRRRQFLLAVAGCQAVPALAVAAWHAWYSHTNLDGWLTFLYLSVTLLYLLVTLVAARLLYGYWLADAYYIEAEPGQ